MYQPQQFEPTRPEVLADELSAREQYKHYSMQGVEEVKPQADPPTDLSKRRQVKADYRPISMRWPFVSLMLLLMLAAMGLVAWTQRSLKGTDSTATIEQRHILTESRYVGTTPGENILNIRQDAVPSPVPSAVPAPNPEATPEAVPEPAPEPTGTDDNGDDGNNGDAAARVRITTEETSSEFTTTVTIPGSSIVETSSVVTTIESEITTDVQTVIVETETVSTDIVTSQVVQSTIFSTLSDGVVTSIVSENTVAATIAGSATREVSRTTVVRETLPAGVETTLEILQTKTGPPQVYVSTGTTTLVNVYTVRADGRTLSKGEGDAPVTKLITSEVAGKVVTETDAGVPTTIVTTDANGQPITIVSTPSPTVRVKTLPPTRTILTSVSTPTSSSDRIVVETTTLSFTAVSYFLGKFLPPILAVLLGIPLRALDCAAKLYHPFEALSQPRGAAGPASLNLHFEGWSGFFLPFKLMGNSYPATGLTTLLVWISAFLTPVATEAVGMKIHGRCTAEAIDGCGLSLGINVIASGVLIAMLAILALLLLVLLGVLARWRSGVFADPWCIAGMAALARNPDVRSSNQDVKSVVAEKHYAMGWYRNAEGGEEYGLILVDEAGRNLQGQSGNGWDGQPVEAETLHPAVRRQKGPNHFIALTWWWRVLFIFVLCGIAALVLYYHITKKLPRDLQRFVDSQRFGGRFVFSGLGVVVIFASECLFCSIAVIAPYRLMAKRAQPARRSILVTLPTNSFSGIATGIRTGDPVLFVVALMAVLSEFLPILLANVPYNLTQTHLTHDICARTSAGLLILMAAVVLASLFIRWPDMPVDPRSVGGAMWYVSESRWVSGLGGVTAMDKKERKKRVNELGGRWFYGNVFGMRGEQLGVEVEDGYRSGYGGGQVAEYRGPY
ncbi:hypothetical protein ACHAQH_009362 [Verticillium albo-atrum]